MTANLLVFAASHRPESYNRKLASAAAKIALAHNAKVDFAEYAEFDMPIYNDHEASQNHIPTAAQSFLARANKADGIIIATPEYNWSYPGSLKNIIDWTSRQDIAELKHKTVLLLCATPGPRGGIVGLDHLRSPLAALHLHIFNRAFPLGHCQQAFDAEGNLADKPRHQLETIVTDYVTFTRKLSNH